MPTRALLTYSDYAALRAIGSRDWRADRAATVQRPADRPRVNLVLTIPG